jgi:hypothetical protein
MFDDEAATTLLVLLTASTVTYRSNIIIGILPYRPIQVAAHCTDTSTAATDHGCVCTTFSQFEDSMGWNECG